MLPKYKMGNIVKIYNKNDLYIINETIIDDSTKNLHLDYSLFGYNNIKDGFAWVNEENIIFISEGSIERIKLLKKINQWERTISCNYTDPKIEIYKLKQELLKYK